MNKFSDAKNKFDSIYSSLNKLDISFVPVDGKIRNDLEIKNSKNEPNEEYYKWQFIYSLINSGLYSKDYIGAELRFPKGNKNSAPLKIDAVIFDDKDWINQYNLYWENRESKHLDWLNEHIIGIVEFKKNDKEIEKVYNGQIKPAMKQKEPSNEYVLGIYYDTERLFLFHRRHGLYLRYDESKNIKGDNSKTSDLSLQHFDPYMFIPSFDQLVNRISVISKIDLSKRSITDLDVITSRLTVQLQVALSDVLRSLDKVGLVSQRGYEILIQTFALKIFDEKRNDRHIQDKLKFYITEEEFNFRNLSEEEIQEFILRMQEIWDEAEADYRKILGEHAIDWQDKNQVRAVSAICNSFQNFSFVRSSKSDLYQMIFYNFANAFKRDESAQFLTPLPIIDFLVKLINPRKDETVFDPCCGIGDFLSLSYVNSQDKKNQWKLDDANIYGVDIDPNMIKLATLNMLLNGDGEAKLFHKSDKGSILSKVAIGNPPYLVELDVNRHSKGNWDKWVDKTKLMKFDVILTNPPFGEDRAYRPQSDFDKKVIELYEMWDIVGGDSIDLGIVFLENAYRSLKEGGRLGIVISNSIASINKYSAVREWIMNKMRIVATFDLPPNVFAETGVNTSIIIAYKPTKNELELLNTQGYSVFVRDIKNVGYEKRTVKRNVVFNDVYKIDENTFDIMIDNEGNMVKDEEFTEIINDFKIWCNGQEETLKNMFLKED
ncbi:N-6 DNA methylase [Clostridium perfringens]|uniref:HsdM family class I SAM-dependent methyltransferase n=1 Tax=Clostridium perfringens TaxID=1502 RepID=UPI0024BD0D5B|nr:N-6 DNA methylase [Clostridium perfringens]MDK0896768.1 N-6 DNA methylase [Clostridium perfringens]